MSEITTVGLDLAKNVFQGNRPFDCEVRWSQMCRMQPLARECGAVLDESGTSIGDRHVGTEMVAPRRVHGEL